MELEKNKNVWKVIFNSWIEFWKNLYYQGLYPEVVSDFIELSVLTLPSVLILGTLLLLQHTYGMLMLASIGWGFSKTLCEEVSTLDSILNPSILPWIAWPFLLFFVIVFYYKSRGQQLPKSETSLSYVFQMLVGTGILLYLISSPC